MLALREATSRLTVPRVFILCASALVKCKMHSVSRFFFFSVQVEAAKMALIQRAEAELENIRLRRKVIPCVFYWPVRNLLRKRVKSGRNLFCSCFVDPRVGLLRVFLVACVCSVFVCAYSKAVWSGAASAKRGTNVTYGPRSAQR